MDKSVDISTSFNLNCRIINFEYKLIPLTKQFSLKDVTFLLRHTADSADHCASLRRWNGDGDRNIGDGWGLGEVLVPMQLCNACI